MCITASLVLLLMHVIMNITRMKFYSIMVIVLQILLPPNQLSYTLTGLSPADAYVVGLVSYANDTYNFSQFPEILQEGNSVLTINQGDRLNIAYSILYSNARGVDLDHTHIHVTSTPPAYK